MRKVSFVIALFLLAAFYSCEEKTNQNTEPYIVIEPVHPHAKGDRLFGINLSESALGFDDSYAKLQEVGTDMVELNIPWNAIETAEGKYTDPYDNVIKATAAYGATGMKVSFSIALINTVQWEVPEYLKNTPPDHPDFITAFTRMIDWFMNEVPDNVDIPGISIGNEVDLVLESDTEWENYTSFYQAVVQHIHKNYPQIKVGVKTTVMNGLFGSERDMVLAINQYSDVIMLNYYPQNESFQVKPPESVHSDFTRIVSAFPTQEIWMTEVGYQSGDEYCESSETKQAHFFHQMFSAWDIYKNNIKYVLIDWLHDQSDATIAEWKDYYGHEPAMVEYLSTLGLRNYDGTDKPAWLQIKMEAEKRGW